VSFNTLSLLVLLIAAHGVMWTTSRKMQFYMVVAIAVNTSGYQNIAIHYNVRLKS
jgi:hypothetical protein